MQTIFEFAHCSTWNSIDFSESPAKIDLQTMAIAN